MYYTFTYRSLVDFDEEVIGRANGSLIPGAKEYFERMWTNQELIDDAPVFDYFFLQSTHHNNPEKWDWMLQDIHGFTGGEIPLNGWLVSDYFKSVLEQFKLAPPYRFYPAKLKHKGRKLDYYIFNLLWIKTDDVFVYKELEFDLFNTKTGEIERQYPDLVHTHKDYTDVKTELRKKHKLEMKLKKIRVKEYFDFIPLYGINSDVIITERLRDAILKSGIEGVIMQKAPYEVIMPAQ